MSYPNKKHISTLKKIWRFLFTKKTLLLFWVVLLFVYITNTYQTNFSDEFDNIVGGWYINHGILPYVGFFSHHNPGAYYIASVITLFTKQSFVAFRMVWALVLFAAAAATTWFWHKSLKKEPLTFFLVFWFVWAITATFYWGHMLLSETVVGYAIIPAYVLVVLKYLRGYQMSMRDLGVVSLLSAVALLTSFTYIFAVAIFIFFALFAFWKTNAHAAMPKNFVKIALLFSAPFLIFGLYLVITGSAHEFYFQSIQYNRDYYIYNFPIVSGTVSKNPARYALSIFYNNFRQFHSLLTQFDHINFSYPLNVGLFLGNAALIVYLISKREYMLAGVVYLFITFLNSRSEPLSSKETDFHSTVYAIVSIVNFIFITWTLIKEMDSTKPVMRLLFQVLLILLGVYGLFGGLFVTRAYMDKTYARFMGQAPGIYDEPVAAPIINQIVSKDDYFWIGPFEFQELLYINGKLPSKYHWFLPAHERSEKIRTEFVNDLVKNKPKVIVFKEDLGYFGMIPTAFNYPIVTLLREQYVRLADLRNEGKNYRPTQTNLHNFSIEDNFYFDKDRIDEIVKILLDKKIIEPVSS